MSYRSRQCALHTGLRSKTFVQPLQPSTSLTTRLPASLQVGRPRRRTTLLPRHLAPQPAAAGSSRRGRHVAAPAFGFTSAAYTGPEPDPDAYEHEEEDSDDYGEGEGFQLPPALRRGAGAAAAAAAADGSGGGAAVSAGIEATGADATDAQAAQRRSLRRRRRGQHGLSRSLRLLRLFGASLSRLLSRLSVAVQATSKAAWQLVGEALQALRVNTVRAGKATREGLAASALGKRMEAWQQKLDAAQQELPEDLWGKVMWLWERPDVQKLRLTISMANFSIRLPALVALVATQIGLLSTSLSLPMLAPLLLGTGMLLRSIRTNASLVFPRIGLLVVLLWLLWFANSVIQNTVAYLRKQGAIDGRLANNINSAAELAVLVTASIILLSMLGVNVSALLLPAGVAAAVAAKDLSQNFLAGFFLMMVQPFRLGDRVGVTLTSGSPGGFGGGGSWFEGVCEKVDLRYTSLRQGRRRLMVPNSAFLQQPFMILEDVPASSAPGPASSAPGAPAPAQPAAAGVPGMAPVGYQQHQQQQQPFVTRDGRYVWQAYVDGAPVHQELAQEAAMMAPPPPGGMQGQAAAAAVAAQGPAGAAQTAEPQQGEQSQQQTHQTQPPVNGARQVPPLPPQQQQQYGGSSPYQQQQQQQVYQFQQSPPPTGVNGSSGMYMYGGAPPQGGYPGPSPHPPGSFPSSYPLPPQALM